MVTEDQDTRGGGRFQMKIYPSGAKAFQFQYFFDKKRRRIEIGRYGTWSLAGARRKFFELSEVVEKGGDPQHDKQQKVAEKKAREAKATMAGLIAHYMEHAEANFTAHIFRRLQLCFAKDLQPFVDDTISPAEFIEQDLARELIYKVYNRGAKEKASIFRTSLMSMFKFAIDYDLSPER